MMKVVVTGGGAVGRHLSTDLAERGHDVTLIEQDRAIVEHIRTIVEGVRIILGDACEPWVLEEADLGKAEVVVAATGDDEDNLVTSLLADQSLSSVTNFALTLFVITLWLARNIRRSGFGRLLVAIRDNEDNARAFTVRASVAAE